MSSPTVPQVKPVVAVFGSSAAVPGDGDYENGVLCGRLLAEAGCVAATGGYGGLMEAVSRGAHLAGGAVIGVTAPAAFPGRAGANEFVTQEWPASHLVERIHRLTDASVASIALPGSLGTLTEVVVAWNLAFVARFSSTAPKPVVTVGPMWRDIIATLAGRLGTDSSLVTNADDVTLAVKVVADWLGSHPMGSASP